MRKDLLKLAAKGAAGFLIALAIWLGLSLPYTRLLATVSEGLIRLSERPTVTSISTEGTLMVVGRSDLAPPRGSGQLAVESTDLTFNFILLAALFAARKRALSDRNVFGFLVATVVLMLVHVMAVVAFVKSYYAVGFGSWSASHYGVVARSFWVAAPYFYSVIGVYAFAFGLWWLFRAPFDASSPPVAHRASRRRRTARAA